MLDYRVITFLALYDEMNYRKTAEKLNMTQPGVTQHQADYALAFRNFSMKSASATQPS